MKIIRYGLFGSALLVALLLAGGLFMPSGWAVERQVTIEASPATVASFITDLRKWEQWIAWNREMDPEARWQFFGAEQGVGAKMAWEGKKLGVGMITLTKVEPEEIGYEMEMEGKLEGSGEQTRMKGGSPARGSFRLAAQGGGTQLTWKDQGDMGMNIPGRYFVPMLERMLGEHFEQGLAKLKAAAEKAEKTQEELPAQAEAAP